MHCGSAGLVFVGNMLAKEVIGQAGGLKRWIASCKDFVLDEPTPSEAYVMLRAGLHDRPLESVRAQPALPAVASTDYEVTRRRMRAELFGSTPPPFSTSIPLWKPMLPQPSHGRSGRHRHRHRHR